MNVVENRPARFQVGIDTLQILKMLQVVREGEVITYEELSKAVGYDVRTKRSALSSAIKKMRNEYAVVFASVTGVGYKMLNADEIVKSAPGDILAINRRTSVASRKLGCVNYDSLQASAKVQHNASASVLAALNVATTPKMLARVEKRVLQAGARIDIQATLELLK